MGEPARRRCNGKTMLKMQGRGENSVGEGLRPALCGLEIVPEPGGSETRPYVIFGLGMSGEGTCSISVLRQLSVLVFLLLLPIEPIGMTTSVTALRSSVKWGR